MSKTKAINIYGIKNCDTMKKAFKWLDKHNIIYKFHDYKKEPIDINIITMAFKQQGIENTINRRGTTWRKLPDNVKVEINEEKALKIIIENPSIVKRPLLVYEGNIVLGFKDDVYSKIFKHE